MRTSSATNVGDGKDSEARQRKAIEGYAKATGMVIVDWFYDAAVSGADPNRGAARSTEQSRSRHRIGCTDCKSASGRALQ